MIAPVKKQAAQNLLLYELKITLRGSKPAIWRRVQVPGNINLNRLHDVFQVVMGWTDSHLHQFVDALIVYSVPSGDEYRAQRRGLTQAAATTAITGAKLMVGTITQQTSGTVATGKVISQDPASGSSVGKVLR